MSILDLFAVLMFWLVLTSLVVLAAAVVREIAVRMGWKAKDPAAVVCSCRHRGYDLPHRRTPEQIARMTADSGAHLAKARAVYRQSVVDGRARASRGVTAR